MIVRTLLLLGLASGAARAGDGYEVTAAKDGQEVRYKVNFGGGRRFDQWTAFDPATKTFVYLRWTRGQPAPEPAASVWDHRTGETVKLYTFPGADHPLPVIPSMDAMKVCPLTGDAKFTAKRTVAYD